MSRSKAAPPDTGRTIVLLRHGIAEDKSADGTDASRKLTAQGRSRMKEIAGGLEKLLPTVEAVYTSPLLRAVQTAQVVARAYGPKVGIITVDALSPEGTPKAFRELLDSLEHRRAIFVGHEPNLSEIFRALLGIHRQKGRIELKKGGCYALTIGPDGVASLDFAAPPRVMRRV